MIKSLFLIFLLSILILQNGISQTKLSKEEIYKSWNARQGSNFINEFISRVSDSMRENKIDTFCVFVFDYPGFIFLDSCLRNSHPSEIYLYWKQAGKIFGRFMTDKCSVTEFNLSNDSAFKYFEMYSEDIMNETIMPVIYGASRDEKSGDITYECGSIDHEPKYSIYCRMSGIQKSLWFSQNDISNKENIFYTDNINSKSYYWFRMLEEQSFYLFRK